MSTEGVSGRVARAQVDVRMPRLQAVFTAALLLVGTFVSLLGNSVTQPGYDGSATAVFAQRLFDPGALILLLCAVLFAWSLFWPKSQPIAVLVRAQILPRMAAPTQWEDVRPPRFAQLVGLLVVGVGVLLHLAGVPYALVVAGSLAFIAAFLNAAFGFCMGCEIYVLLVRAGLIKNTRETLV